MSKNKSSALPANPFFILVHFFAVLVLKTTWIDQFSGCVEDVRTKRNIKNTFSPQQPNNSCQFYSCKFHKHFPFRTTWGCNEVITITRNSIFRRRSPWRRRCPCISCLLTAKRRPMWRNPESSKCEALESEIKSVESGIHSMESRIRDLFRWSREFGIRSGNPRLGI